MNLEDRLRNHMHSAEDLFVDGRSSASEIATAGQRRTRRTRVGAGLAAGVLGIGLVLGATSLGGSSDPVDFASQDSAASAESGLDAAPQAQEMESEAFDGPLPSFDVIVGFEDGFVGLRTTNGTIIAIESPDGLTWAETPATGLDDGIEIAALTQGDGVFAGVFRAFEKNTGFPQNFIGTSADGANWTLVQVLDGQPDAFVSGLAVNNGTIVTAASAFGAVSEDEDGEITPTGYVISGPVGGPYAETILDAVAFGVERIAAIESGFALSAFGEGQPAVWTSLDGEAWSAASVADPSNQFSTIASLNGELLSIGSTNFGGSGTFQIFESSDSGGVWTPVGIPTEIVTAPWWSFDVRSNNDVVAVLLTGEAEVEVEGLFTSRAALLTSTGGDSAEFVEIDLGPFVPDTASVILMGVSEDEVLLQVIDAPENFDESLASSSSAADDSLEFQPAAVSYVRVPFP